MTDINAVVEHYVKLRDHKTLLDAESPGPLFFVRLPAGSYRISADLNGTPVRKAVAVSDRRRQNLYFYWPREAIEKGRL